MSTPASDARSHDGSGIQLSNRIALTIEEAAKALGVSRRTVEGMIDRREIKTRLVGRYQLISVDSLKRLFQ